MYAAGRGRSQKLDRARLPHRSRVALRADRERQRRRLRDPEGQVGVRDRRDRRRRRVDRHRGGAGERQRRIRDRQRERVDAVGSGRPVRELPVPRQRLPPRREARHGRRRDDGAAAEHLEPRRNRAGGDGEAGDERAAVRERRERRRHGEAVERRVDRDRHRRGDRLAGASGRGELQRVRAGREPGGGVKTNDCAPAGWEATNGVASVTPFASTSVAVTVAACVSVYEIVAVSSLGSPPGLICAGDAVVFWNASAATFVPSVPDAPSREAGPAIVHVYRSGGAEDDSHVQLRFGPVPEPWATCAPAELVTVTVHGTAPESRPLKITRPPSFPVTSGAYSFGSPIRDTSCAIPGSSAYSAFPGQSVKYVSRCPEIGPQEHRRAAREARVAGRLPAERRQRIDMREIELPRQQLLERAPRRRADPRRVVVAEHGDADRAGVEAHRVRADHRPVDSAVPPFEDLAVLVDEEVVADVVPAVRDDVVDLDPAHDRGRLRRRVRVRAGGVVDDREVHGVEVLRRRTADLLVRAPGGARDDRRRARDRQPPDAELLDGTLDVVRAEARHGPARAEPDRRRLARPGETAEMPAGQAVLRAAGIRRDVGVGRAASRSSGRRRRACGRAPCRSRASARPPCRTAAAASRRRARGP